MVFLNRLNPFRSHQERSQAPTSSHLQPYQAQEPTDRRETIDEWLFVSRDHSVVPASRRSSIESHRGRGSIDSQRRRGSMDSQRRRGSMEAKRRPSVESQRRNSLGDWEVVVDDNNHNVVEYLEDCNAPVQDPDCLCMTCVGFFQCRTDPEAAKKVHRNWHRQCRGLPDIEEDEPVDQDESDGAEKKDQDGKTDLTIARPPRAHLAKSRGVQNQHENEEEGEQKDSSLHAQSASKNYPMCDNGGVLLEIQKSKSLASSFANMFNYRY
ncbi:hypothetical protein EG328_002902 [Venturia inaequalis]|uniref:Uncharacterized protein n=1 Tax=Venturia inaequalis TaxID=5025 RepID=A0A8H3VMA3_VENIN|nr:hypothetical protein EG328_002902 [Venturia inaequalis]KAE9990268.1 hypothetical protein EG327_001651 [Venturia inaequalis]RDI77971.1 hypothetical protein Vi05172_g12060 [Venturia inaequalis]